MQLSLRAFRVIVVLYRGCEAELEPCPGNCARMFIGRSQHLMPLPVPSLSDDRDKLDHALLSLGTIHR